MAGTTTYYGISYPTNTDYVKDGATAMQTIADGFDSAVAIPTYNNQTGTTYTFVLADAGKTVTSNNASAVTFTIPPQTSVAWANNTTLTVRNLGAGVVTIAGGAGVTVTNTAQTVVQYGEVKLIRTASNAWTVVPAGGAGGLTLIETKSFSGQSTVQFDNVFNSTYDNYKILYSLSSLTVTATLQMRFVDGTSPITTQSYIFAYGAVYINGTTFNDYSTNSGATYISFATANSGNGGLTKSTIEVYSPALARDTGVNFQSTSNNGTNTYTLHGGGLLNTNTQVEGIHFFQTGGNITGQISIYGYQK